MVLFTEWILETERNTESKKIKEALYTQNQKLRNDLVEAMRYIKNVL